MTFSLLVIGVVIVMQKFGRLTAIKRNFQSPSNWSSYCNRFKKETETVKFLAFQSPSNWSSYCNQR